MQQPFHRAFAADHSIGRPDVIEPDGAATWITRGANFVIAITRAAAGTTLACTSVPDEHMILLTGAGARIEASGSALDAAATIWSSYRLATHD